MTSSALYKGLSWVVTLLIPILLILTAVRLLLTPLFVSIEYNTPGFPADPYGFTKEDRLYWSNIARVYLLNNEGISYLADLRFPNGQIAPPGTCKTMDDCTRLYNNRELKHMSDVKSVVHTALNVWYVSLILIVVLGVWAWWGEWWKNFRQGLFRGGWLTVILLLGTMAFVILAFGLIFVAFHNVFFESGTWTFLYSDTLIRLFPERFWRDAFLAIGLLAGGMGVILVYLFRERVDKAQGK